MRTIHGFGAGVDTQRRASTLAAFPSFRLGREGPAIGRDRREPFDILRAPE